MNMPSKNAAIEPSEPQAPTEIAEPVEPGTSMTYLGGRPLRRYLIWYTLASMAWVVVTTAISGILLPNQVQSIEFARFFTGADARVDLTALARLRDAVAGGATATADQMRLLDLFAQFDASRAQALTLVITLGTVATMIVGPLVGVLSDHTRSRLGRRAPWLLIGAGTGAGFVILLRFAPSIALLALLWSVTQGAVNIAVGPLNTTVADRILKSKRGIASAAGGLGNYLGGIIGVVFASTVFARLGLNTYFILAVVLVAFLVGFVFLVRDRPSTALHVPPLNWGNFFRGFLVPLRDSDFRWVWVERLVLLFGYTTSSAVTLYMLQSYITPSLSAAEATKMMSNLSLAGLPTTLVALCTSGWLSDKIGRRKPFVIAASLLMACSMAIMVLSPTLPAMFIQAALSGLAFGIYLPVDQALFIDVLPDKNALGRDLGIATLATVLGQALGPVLAGEVVALTGGYRMIWVVGVVLVLVAAVAIVPVKRVR